MKSKEHPSWSTERRLGAAFICLALLLSTNNLAAECKLVNDPVLKAEVQKRLKAEKNGLIVVFRHTSKCDAASEGCARETTIEGCLHPEEPLSDSGIREASSIGRSLSKLKVSLKNARILHSEYCRTARTSHLIFGKDLPRSESNLNSGCDKSTAKDCYSWLKERLNDLGQNSSVFLITHSSNIGSLGFQDFNTNMPYGVAAIIDPLKEKNSYLGCLLWNDWEKLADGQ